MSLNVKREQEALDWSEEMLGDVADA
jgi:hypothetical protein